MFKPNFLNTREAKKIKEMLFNQWGVELEGDYFLIRTEQDRIYLINKDISVLDFNKIRLDSIGLYFGRIAVDGLRVTVEGSQMIGKYAKKNICEINKEQLIQWFRGEDLNVEQEFSGHVIIKYNNDYVGCGKYRDHKVLNFLSKNRRLLNINE